MNKSGVNQSQVKVTNQALIIDEIRRAGQLSRSQLARNLKLSAPSISTNIDDLISRNVILEKGTGKSECGRKPINLEFNNDYGYIAAIDMISSNVRIALSDLSGRDILDDSIIEDALIITEEVIERTMDSIELMLKNKSIDRSKLLCISIGTPGIIEPKTGEFLLAPRIENYRDKNFISLFKKRFNCEIIVKNDVNCATIGEHICGLGRSYSNFINIYVDIGTGSGLILNGRLFEGARGGAGEFGLFGMDINRVIKDRKISQGNIADDYISIFGIILRVIKDCPDIYADFKDEELNIHVIQNYTDRLFQEVEMGNEKVVTIVQKSAIALGFIIKNICDLLDLEIVMISGLALNFGQMYIKTIQDFLKNNTARNIEVIPSELGHKAVVYGALEEGIQRVLRDIVALSPSIL